MRIAERPSLLFVSPAVPHPTGGGLRMRAWQFLVAAARRHRITLVAGSPHFADEDRASLDLVAPLVERAIVLPWRRKGIGALLGRGILSALRSPASVPEPFAWAAPTALMRRPLAELRRLRFDRVHVFRLYMLPLALEILGGDAEAITILDLDDWDSETHRSIAGLPTLSARRRRAFALEADRFAGIEAAWLPRLRTLLVASEADRAALSSRHGVAGVLCVDNAVDVPDAMPRRTPIADPLFLFIGSLGYAPNDDALRFLLGEVWPGVATAFRGARLRVVGGGASRTLRRLLHETAGVTATGRLEHVDEAYAGITASVLPLRAGGGTRLKALEAFARGCPLISTALGVAGLGVDAGVHYQRAESAEQWRGALVDRCASPARDDARGEAAFRWVRERSFAVVATRIESLFQRSG